MNINYDYALPVFDCAPAEWSALIVACGDVMVRLAKHAHDGGPSLSTIQLRVCDRME